MRPISWHIFGSPESRSRLLKKFLHLEMLLHDLENIASF